MPTAAIVTLASGVLVPIITPNDVTDGDGFYVSYNGVDSGIYGGQTTALVIGQMQAFYILNGDHQAAYAELIPQGLPACMAYFQANAASINKHSDRIPEA